MRGKTPQTPHNVTAAARLYLGDELSLARLAPVIEQFRASLGEAGSSVELDARDLMHVTEAGSLLFASEIDRAERLGVHVSMAA